MSSDIEKIDHPVIIYSVLAPESGPVQRFVNEEDLIVAGGINGIEKELETECYWFVRLGTVPSIPGPMGATVHDSDMALLPVPALDKWQIGRRNPAFSRPALERSVFRALFQAAEQMLDSWTAESEGAIDAYALRQIELGSDRLISICGALNLLHRVHDVVEIAVLKYWSDPSWPRRSFSVDLVTAEFSLVIPVRLSWAEGPELLDVKFLPFASC